MTATRPGGLIRRQDIRRAWQGMLTVSGIAKRGFFIPCGNAGRISAHDRRRSYEAVELLFRHREDALLAFLAEMESRADALLALGGTPPPGPSWRQDWFPRLDAAAAYTMVQHLRPRRIIEVGCGHSTRFVMQAVRDAGLATEVTAIDPAPRADLGTLPLALRHAFVQELPLTAFTELQAGDFLMIDSSHILMPGSDVDFLFNRVLPLLPAGIVVHVHDIFLPDDYPAAWEWRGYNEQQAVIPLLTSGGWDLLHSSHYLATRLADRLAAGPLAGLPLVPGAREVSLWMRKSAPAVVLIQPRQA